MTTLWVTDGSRAGTFPVRVVSESGLDELWVSNGTRPGTRLLKTIRAGE